MNSPIWIRLCRKSPPLTSFQLRQFQGTSSVNKKQYGYDLDSLIQWKQETTLLFGPQRKFTKTGKLRKKKLDKHCLENLETLSSVSNKDIQYSVENLGKNSPSDFQSANSPSDSSYLSISESQGISSEGDEDVQKSVGVFEDVKKQKNLSRKSSANVYGAKQATLRQTDHTAEPSAISRRKNFNLTNSNKGSPQFSNSDDIKIPKLEPVPLEKESISVKKSLQSPSASLPVEAPASFQVVTKFPLAPLAITDSVEQQLFQTFKDDVERMALRFLPSVKTVLNKTMPELNRFFLNRWREGMVEELGEEGFQKYKNETMRQGTNLHANIMEFLSGTPETELQIMPENEGHWASLHSTLQSVSDIRALERDMLHPHLLYRGVLDCVARYKDVLCVIDWKVSKKPRPLLKNTYDDPLQVAAYVGAMNATDDYVKQHGEIHHGLIVVAYPDGSPAHTHMLSRSQVALYWQEWTARLHNFYTLTYTDRCGHKT